MQLETIESKIQEIPLSPLDVVADDHEIWEETDGGAHFKMTRHNLLPSESQSIEFYALSISGLAIERNRVTREFSQVLGRPFSRSRGPKIDMLAWFVDPYYRKNLS